VSNYLGIQARLDNVLQVADGTFQCLEPKQFISLAMMEMKLEGTKEFPSGETRTQNRRRGKSMRHG
jgi:hypothetical protein